jgi:hypothetical protein
VAGGTLVDAVKLGVVWHPMAVDSEVCGWWSLVPPPLTTVASYGGRLLIQQHGTCCYGGGSIHRRLWMGIYGETRVRDGGCIGNRQSSRLRAGLWCTTVATLRHRCRPLWRRVGDATCVAGQR